MKLKTPCWVGVSDRFSYKGYLVMACGEHGLAIKKAEYFIGWAKDHAEALATIDLLVG